MPTDNDPPAASASADQASPGDQATSSDQTSGTDAPPQSHPHASSSSHFLKIMIRNPTDVTGTPPYVVSVAPSSTVHQLKEQLNASYRDNPPIMTQRLIYAGRLLNNSSTISSIITDPHSSVTHTFHLVVSSRAAPQQLSSSAVASTSAAASSSTSAPTASASSSSFRAPATNPTGTTRSNSTARMNPTTATTPASSSTANAPAVPTAGQTHPHQPSSQFGFRSPYSSLSNSPYAYPYHNAAPYHYYNPHAYYQHYQPYMPYTAVPPPPPPQSGQSTTPATSSRETPESYEEHLRTMERLLAEATQAQLQAIAAETAAQTYLQARNYNSAAMLRTYAAQLQTQASHIHAQTHAHARAHPVPPRQPAELNPEEMERLIAEAGTSDQALPGIEQNLERAMSGATNASSAAVHRREPPAAVHQVQAAAEAAAAAAAQQMHLHNLQLVQQHFGAHAPIPQPVPQPPHAAQPQPQPQPQPDPQPAPAQPQQQPNLDQWDGQQQRPVQRGMRLPRGVNIRFARFPVDANGQIGQPRQFVFRFQLNWVLMLKLIIFVYVLSQEATAQKTYGLIALAVLIYMLQMGYLRFARRLIETALPNPGALINRMFPGQGQDANRNDNDAPVQGEGAENAVNRPNQRFGRVAVVFSFVYSFIYGFICSLLPAWNAEPHARMDELLPQANNNNNNGNNDEQGNNQPRDVDGGHEHAD